MSRIAAVVLAAGEGSRFGGPKQYRTLPEVLARLAEAWLDEVVVVEGAYPLADHAGTARIVSCAGWTAGPGASLRAGLGALDPEVAAAVVVLADGPELDPRSVRRVLEAWAGGDEAVAASYDGTRSHPLVLPRSRWTAIPDEGLRGLPVRLVPCDGLSDPGDVDTPADLPSRLRD